MLVGIEGESEGYRMSIVPSGVLTVYLRVHRFYCQLFPNSSIILVYVLCVMCVLPQYSAIRLLDVR